MSKHMHSGETQPHADYAGNMKKISKKGQSIMAEPGNNGTVNTAKGQVDFAGSYAAGLKKSQ